MAMGERISARFTVPLKWLLPLAALCLIGTSVAEDVAKGHYAVAGVFVFAAVVFLVFYKFLVFDLADEVHDEVGSLWVRRRGAEEQIPYENIRDVTFLSFARPPYVILQLVKPGAFGRQIFFLPSSAEPIEHLILRVKAARTKPAG